MTNLQQSRRQFLRHAALTAPAVWLGMRTQVAWGQDTAVPAMVQQARAAAATAKITTQALRGNVSVLMGSGGNIAVLPGPEGLLLVDSGYSTSQPQLIAAAQALGKGPMKMLINTHWHFDHTDGNLWMHEAGATIVAHENTRKHLSETTEMKAFHLTLPPAPAGALPREVFATTKTVKMNGAKVELVHYAPAHTDSDTSVRFTEANVLHAGDTLFNGFYPFIDYSTGGSIDGMIAASERNVAVSDAQTMIIPGHGPVATRADVQAVLEMLKACRESVAKLKKQGKTLEETVAAAPTAAYDAKWGGGFVNPPTFVALVYQGV